MNPIPSPDRLRELLSYDKATGRIAWAVNQNSRARAGGTAGWQEKHGYWYVSVDGRTYAGHRVAWALATGMWPTGVIDHVNGVRNDNRLENLRDTTPAINQHNRQRANRNNRSGLLGVTERSATRFEAHIQRYGIYRHLGSFATSADAHAAYLSAKTAVNSTPCEEQS